VSIILKNVHFFGKNVQPGCFPNAYNEPGTALRPMVPGMRAGRNIPKKGGFRMILREGKTLNRAERFPVKCTGLFVAIVCLFLAIPEACHAAAGSGWLWPVDPQYNECSQPYKGAGDHAAIDISVSYVTVRASKAGTVISTFEGCQNQYCNSGMDCVNAGVCSPTDNYWMDKSGRKWCNYGYGNGIVIGHDDGTYSQYAHLEWVYVEPGQRVDQGEEIGYSGSYGCSMGPHLHFGLASYYDPYHEGTFNSNSINSNPRLEEYDIWELWNDKAPTPLYDANGVDYIFQADSSAPVVQSAEVTNITTEGFDVVCRITDNIGVTYASFAVWTGENTGEDQDDIYVYEIYDLSSGTATDGIWTCHVDIANHLNDRTKPYCVDIRGYDAADNETDPYTHLSGIKVKQLLSRISIQGAESIELMRGETKQLLVETEPADYNQSGLVWSCSDSRIATVTGSGLVTSHHMGTGSVTIVCASQDGSISDSVTLRVKSNLGAGSAFYVDQVPASLTEESGELGVVAVLREAGDQLACAVVPVFETNVQTYEVEYEVEEGNLTLYNDSLFVGKNGSDRSVVVARIYDRYEDGTRGPLMNSARITVFKESGGQFVLPANLQLIEANAFEGTAASSYVLPDSLSELSPGSLAGIPVGARILFNSDRLEPFYDYSVLGLSASDAGTEDYLWLDTGTLKMNYRKGNGCRANYYCLVDQAE